MKEKNPFLFITPRGEESIIGREGFYKKLKSKILKSLDNKKIISVNGDFGMGKTFFVKKIIKELNERKNLKVYNYDFNFNTINHLRRLPSENDVGKEIIVLIDRFELILFLASKWRHKVLELMRDLCKAEITVIITTTDDLLNKIQNIEPSIKNFFEVVNVPAMNFKEAKELILSRLNKVRKKSSDSLKPLTKDEVREVYETSEGNPRMMLMLCAALYDKKV